MMRRAWPCGLFILVLAAACPQCPEPSPIRVTQRVGPQGGTIEHPSGARLVIPEGALDHEVEFSMEDVKPLSSQELGGQSVGPALIIGPEGQVFRKPCSSSSRARS